MIETNKESPSDSWLAQRANKELGTRGLKLHNIEYDGSGRSTGSEDVDYFYVVHLEVNDKSRNQVLKKVKDGIAEIRIK